MEFSDIIPKTFSFIKNTAIYFQIIIQEKVLYKIEKKMKNSIICTLLMFMATFVFAQDKSANLEAKVQKKVDRMTQQLDLSDEQQAEVKDLLMEQQQQRLAIKKSKKDMTEEERAVLKAERKADKKDFNAKLNNILSPEQQAIYKSAKADRKKAQKGKKGKHMKKKQKMKGKGKSPEQKAERKVSRLTKELNLSADQQEQMMELMLSKSANHKELSDAKKAATSEEEHENLKAKRKELKANYKEKFEAILDAEQLATYKKNKETRRTQKKMRK